MFAGQESLNGYQELAAVYEKNPGYSTKYWPSPRRLEIRLPDRTLYLTAKSGRSNVLLPFSADVLVSTRRDLNHWKTLDSDILLFNPVHAPQGLDTKPYWREGIEVLVDSGGFQLIQGSSEFVSPETTVNFYNKRATIGVGLDFPAPPPVDARMYKINCALQKINNEYIRARLNDLVTLAPVIHGATPLTRDYCLKTVYKKGRDPVLAVSGLIARRGDTLELMKQRLACLALILHKTRADVHYYHLLGATSIFWHAVNTLLVSTGYVNSMGGDSVSHRQAAIGGSYNLIPHFNGPQAFNQPVATHQAAHLPCHCPICVIAGDARVLRDFRMSELHHTYVGASVKRYVEENVRQYVRGNLSRAALRVAILGPKSADSTWWPFAAAFDYFEQVVVKGYDQVKPLVPYEGVTVKKTLFGSSKASPKLQSMLDRYTSIHKSYEAFHKVKFTKA